MQLSDIKKLKRFKDIVTILAKYGFDEVVDRFDVPGADFLHSIVQVDTNLGLFERIRTVIEELGPTFIKFGQIMSLRPDLLPEELLDGLEKVQDKVPAVESADIIPVIEKCLGRPIVKVFSLFDNDRSWPVYLWPARFGCYWLSAVCCAWFVACYQYLTQGKVMKETKA